jgi:hypothetical protein
MQRSQTAAWAMLALALSACGRGGPSLYRVYGKVIYKGQPATGAAVHFRRDGDTGPEGASFPIGLVDEAGDFRLELEGVGQGAPAGKYKVLVLWPEDVPLSSTSKREASKSGKPAHGSVASADRKGPKSVVDRLKYRYFSHEKPLLKAEVTSGSNQLEPFELKD